MRRYLIILTLFASLYAGAQNFEADIKNINLAYVGKELSFRIIYRAYATHTSATSIDVQRGLVYTDGNTLNNKIGNVITITTDGYFLVVDKDDKSIFVSRIINKKDLTKELLSIDLGKLSEYYHVENFEQKDNISTYIVSLGAGEIEKFRISFDSRTYLIKRLTLFYRDGRNFDDPLSENKEKPRLDIVYTVVGKDEINMEEFNVHRYVNINKKQVTLGAGYLDYQLIDQYSK